MQKPDVEHIDGLSPAISIEQKTTIAQPALDRRHRHRNLRLYAPAVGAGRHPLLARHRPADRGAAGQPDGRPRRCSCPKARAIICSPRSSAAARASIARNWPNGRRPASPASASTANSTTIEDAPALDKKYKHDIEVVVDRIVIREGIETRLADSFETALKLAEGLAYLDPADVAPPRRQRTHRRRRRAGGRGRTRRLQARLRRPPAASPSPRNSPAPSPASPSPRSSRASSRFNAPQGACPACDGLGEKQMFDEDLVVPNHALSLKKGAVVPWAKSQPPSPYYMQVLGSLARAYDFSTSTRRGASSARRRSHVILRGTGGRPVTLRFVDGKKSYEVKKPFEGVIGNLERRMLSTESAWMREELSQLPGRPPVRDLRRRPPPARAAGGQDRRRGHLALLAPLGRRRAGLVLVARPASHPDPERDRQGHPQGDQRAPRLPPQCRARLPQPRPHQRHAQSGGESQRIRLASQIGSGLSGVLYVLDEPSIGLHQKDNDRLLETLKRLARPRQHRAGGRA